MTSNVSSVFSFNILTKLSSSFLVASQVGSYNLQQVDIKVQKCTTVAAVQKWKNSSTAICAGFPEGGKDTCQGDSGGPYFFKNKNGGYTLHGIISGGDGCALPRKYGLYTKVSSFLDWIQSKIEELSEVYKKKN